MRSLAKILCLILALTTILLSVAACSSDKPSDNGDVTEEAETPIADKENSDELVIDTTSVVTRYIGDFKVFQNEGELTILEYLGKDSSVTIPEMLFGMPVVAIEGYAFNGRADIVSIDIPSSVIKVGPKAFTGTAWFNGLSDEFCVVGGGALIKYNGASATPAIPASVKSIGPEVFKGKGVTSVSIPDGVSSIGFEAFYGCTGLSYVSLPSTLTYIGDNAFLGCTNLTSITIPESVKTIGWSAFSGCSKLSSMLLPEGLVDLGGYAFDGCSGLTTVSLPSSIDAIGKNAFRSCASLSTITIPADSTVGTNPFNGTNIIADSIDDVVTVGDGILIGYKGTEAIEVTIPANVKKVFAYAFADAKVIQKITFNAPISDIGVGAFDGAASLTTIELSDAAGDPFAGSSLLANATDEFFTIGKGILIRYNGKDSKVDLPNEVSALYKYSFSGNTGITALNIPNSVKSIDFGVFNSLPSLSKLSFVTKTTGLNGEEKISEIDSKDKTPMALNGWYSAHSEDYAMMGSILGAYNGSESAVTLADTITGVAPFAFDGNISVGVLTLSNSMTAISNYAFYNCGNLKVVRFSPSIKEIGNSAFKKCQYIEKIELPNGLTTIGAEAFMDCTKLSDIFIPASCDSIDETAFTNVPNSLKIHGEKGSAAETFAKAHKFKFTTSAD